MAFPPFHFIFLFANSALFHRRTPVRLRGEIEVFSSKPARPWTQFRYKRKKGATVLGVLPFLFNLAFMDAAQEGQLLCLAAKAGDTAE